jgi:hypothetical protein
MKHMKHDELMNMIRFHGLPSTTEAAISRAIKERDEARYRVGELLGVLQNADYSAGYWMITNAAYSEVMEE